MIYIHGYLFSEDIYSGIILKMNGNVQKKKCIRSFIVINAIPHFRKKNKYNTMN